MTLDKAKSDLLMLLHSLALVTFFSEPSPSLPARSTRLISEYLTDFLSFFVSVVVRWILKIACDLELAALYPVEATFLMDSPFSSHSKTFASSVTTSWVRLLITQLFLKFAWMSRFLLFGLSRSLTHSLYTSK